MRAIRSHVMANLELYLMGLSVAVALALPFAIEVGTNDQELAVTALAACVFQGVAFWLIRRRYRQVRREMIAELRAMLKDRINNQLTIVLMSVTERRDSRASETERELLQAAIAATAAVSNVLDELSVESLRRWKTKYQIDIVTPITVRSSGGRAVPGAQVGSEGAQSMPGQESGGRNLQQNPSREAEEQQKPAHVGKSRHEN